MPDQSPNFLYAGGDAARAIASADWARHPLGLTKRWPQNLHTALGMVLPSAFPMCLLWGREHLSCFCNDACWAALGEPGKKPPVGRPAREVWPELWPIIGPAAEQVLEQGRPVHFENQRLPVVRNGVAEDSYWTLSYSPVFSDDGRTVSGVLTVAHETTAQVALSREREQREVRLDNALEIAGLGSYQVDAATNTGTYSHNIAEWFGLPPGPSPMADILACVHPEDRDRVQEAIGQSLTGEAQARHDVRYRTIDAETGAVRRHLHSVGKAMYHEGRPTIIGTIQDITGRVSAEAAIRESEERYQAFIRQSSEGIWRFEMDEPVPVHLPAQHQVERIFQHAYLAECNDAMARMYGYDRAAQLIGMHIDEFMARDAAAETYIHSFVESGYRVMNAESAEKNRDGQLVVFMNNLVGIVEDGHLQRAWGTQRDVTEERTNDALLRESEARFRKLADESPAFIFMTDAEIRVTFLNRTWLGYCGLREQDAKSRGWELVTHPDDLPRLISTYADAVKLRKAYAFEVRQRRATDGQYRWILWQGLPRTTGAGIFAGYMGSGIDIHERKTAEVALRESEARFRSLIEESPVATCLFVGPELRIELANQPMIEYMGKGPGVVGKPLAEALPELADQPFLPLLQDLYATGRVYEAKDQRADLTRDGRMETCYFDLTFKPLRDANGQVWAILDLSQDVTRQVMSRRVVEESQQELLALFEQSPVGIALLDADDLLSFRMANAFYGSLVDRQPEAIIGKPLLEALPELRGQGFDALLHNVVKTGKAYIAGEVPLDIRRGAGLEKIYVDLAYNPRKNADGRVTGILVVATDVTGQVVARRRVEESEAYFRRLTDTSPAIIWITEPDGRCSYLNRSWYEYTGQTVEEAAGHGWLDATHPDDHGQSGARFLEANQTRQPFNLLYRLRNALGEYRWAIASGRPRFSEDGAYQGMIGTVIDVHEQKVAEDRARASEAKLRSVFEQAPVAMGLFVGRDLVVEMPNKAFIEVVGKGPDIAGKPLREVMPELLSEGQPFLKILDDVWTTGVPFQTSAALVKIFRNGRLNDDYFNITYAPIFDEKGEVFAILDIAVDVTEAVKGRQAVADSEQRLRSVVESAPFPIGIYVGEELRIQLANQTIIDIFGKGPDVIGRLYTEVLPELEGSGIFEQLRGVIRTGQPFHANAQRVDLVVDGVLRIFYFNYAFTPLYDSAGEVYAVMNSAADVTAMVLAKEQVEEAEASLRRAIELGELATWTMDIPNNRFHYSARFMEWLGFSENTQGPDAAYNPLPGEYRQRVPAAVQEVIEGKTDGLYDNEHPIVNRLTGQTRIIHAMAQLYYDVGGRPLHLSGLAQDVTEQRRLQELLEEKVAEQIRELAEANAQLTRSNEELAQYAYVASHDLQEPLRKIRMFSGMLGGAQNLDEKHRTHLEKIQQSSARMGQLIQDLLEFSRLLKSDLLMRAVDLNEVAQAVVNDFEVTIEERQAEVCIGPLPTVQAVGLQMNQLFHNLLGNALKFGRPGTPPRIAISCETMDDTGAARFINRPMPDTQYFHIRVSDNGIGFEAQYAEQIFEVFKRLHSRDAYAGSGIGLALCRRIADNHHGRLLAESEPGVGATFHLILPEVQ